MIMNSKISEYCTENKVVCVELILTTKSKDIAKLHKLIYLNEGNAKCYSFLLWKRQYIKNLQGVPKRIWALSSFEFSVAKATLHSQTSVRSFVCLSVCQEAKPLNSLNPSSFIVQPSSFIFHLSTNILHH